MYLSKLHIKNFRCIEELEVEFHQGLNILIGENDTGKTTILDALRLCFELGTERREFYLSPDDFHIDESGNKTETMEFCLTFCDLSDKECGVFIEMLTMKDNKPQLELHLRFTCTPEGRVRRDEFWGGENEGQSIPYQVLDLLYFTHLDALRDARRGLTPSRANQLSKLFMKLEPDEDKQKEYAEDVDKRIRDSRDWKDLLEKGRKKINAHLKEVTFRSDDDRQKIEINFVAAEFRKIVEGLKVHTRPSDDMPPFEIWQNGLGFNNLIYTATVLGDLLERKERNPNSFIALLIEEPEAHLHPQLQNIFFRYLQDIEKQGIQVFVTSHSPTITAKTDIDSLIVLTKNSNGISQLPLHKVGLDKNQKAKLSRFLDVTKSQLFFAKGVVLVEGISEALLMPCFSRLMIKETEKEPKNYDLDEHGVEVVNIGGVAFEPFARLFNSENEEERLNVRCAIITDDDIDPTKEEKVEGPRSRNARELEGGLLKVKCAGYTFEYQLYRENPELIKKMYRVELNHPKINFEGENDEAYAFVKALKNNKEKAVFAQILATKTEIEDLKVRVPNYIQNAIKWVIDGNGNNSN